MNKLRVAAYCRVSSNHEAIIDREVFEDVQRRKTK